MKTARNTRGAFNIAVAEDRSGIFISKLERSDVSDDREKFQIGDYLVSINRRSADELAVGSVKDIIRTAGSILEVEIRRYAPDNAAEAYSTSLGRLPRTAART